MPKTVTSDFEDVQAKHAFPIADQIFYKRRYWDTGTSKYIWEAAWTEILRSEIKTFGTVNQKSDTVQLNQLLSSNVTITLSNAHHVWEEGYNWSKFNADGVSALGYLPYLTKFQTRGGLRLNGTYERVNLFTGYAVKFQTSSKNDLIRITIEGRERILKDANAEDVSTSVDDETPTGAIDSSNKVYTTANNGVGKITEVIVDGSEIEVGKDCSISDTNNPDLPATITCNVAPTTSITCDYFYWNQDELFEDLAELLLQEAGLTAADYDVDAVIFPNDVLNEWEQTDKADWDAGSKTDIDTSTSEGDMLIAGLHIFDDFSDDNYTHNPTWTVQSGSWSVISKVLVAGASASEISTPSTIAYGTWEVKLRHPINNISCVFSFIASSATYTFGYNSYGIVVHRVDGDSKIHVTLQKWIAGGAAINLIVSFISNDSDWHTYRITRTAAGGFELFVDGVSKGTVTDTTHTTSSYYNIRADSVELDDFKNVLNTIISGTSIYPASGNQVTQVLNTGAGNPKSWNLLDHTVTTPSGTSITFETISSTTSGYPGNGHADWIAIAGNRQILSSVKQYLWARPTLTANVAQTLTPTLHDLTVNYATTSSLIALANFTGQTVFQGISELAKMPDYEIGFDADEKFFFRQKTSSEIPDFVFNESDGLIDVISRHEDVSRIYNWIRVNYGAYSKDATPITEGDSQPHSFDKYGKRKLTISGGQIVISESADIATGVAQTFFERYKLPRIVMKIKVKYYPQINLSDVVQVKFDPKKELERIRWDDGVTPYDDGIHRWDGFRTQIIDYLICKVTGISYNIDASQVTLDLEEIL